MRCRVVVFAFAVTTACSRRPAERLDDPQPTSPAPVASSEQEPAPKVLGGVPWLVDLVDADAGSSEHLGFVSVPLGATEPRPVMVALHGGSDRPEWSCGAWRGVSGGYPVLVCPRGPGPSHALSWQSPEDTAKRIDRAIAAAKKLLPGWVREDASIVLAGFSMGAVQGALLARRSPMRYRRIALGESGYNPESSLQFSGPWSAGGGERLLLSCSTFGCEAPYRASARRAAGHGIPVHLNLARTNQHNIDDPVVRSLRRDWPWLVEGAPGWEAYRSIEEDAGVSGKTEIFDRR